ncbi:hypothetical protein LTR84_011447 [Exophiala bonariae]|uniref:Glycosyltransferase 2-like domain-containing protein n=1 Tax=Exophiala bonariae TaxID=1690606 RepID=A0AAV9MUC3_9EURO|nr:hypothetical protein LTR84_011447 [Exophiala bonariae]
MTADFQSAVYPGDDSSLCHRTVSSSTFQVPMRRRHSMRESSTTSSSIKNQQPFRCRSPDAVGREGGSYSPGISPAKQKKVEKHCVSPRLDKHPREPKFECNLLEGWAAATAACDRAAADQVTPAAGDASAHPCYLLPLRWENHLSELTDLTIYLQQLSARCDVLVVDGSPPPVFAEHHRHWASFSTHIAPAPDVVYRNGKVNGVITGVRATTAERVIIADDDVRYDDQSLARTLTLLADADIVVPQNYFDPLPWHAAWDSARILLNRGLGMDYPGTLAIRRTAFMAAGCYDGDVLFENLELMRTLQANGARLVTASDAFVRRLPPEFRHFADQRVRQAYDSLAQPLRLAAEVALLPAVALAVLTKSSWLLLGGAVTAVALAEMGRRRQGGTMVFSWYLPLLAPLWLAERAVCSWLALGSRLRGGVCYRGQRLLRAATSDKVLRRRAAALSVESTTTWPA